MIGLVWLPAHSRLSVHVKHHEGEKTQIEGIFEEVLHLENVVNQVLWRWESQRLPGVHEAGFSLWRMKRTKLAGWLGGAWRVGTRLERG